MSDCTRTEFLLSALRAHSFRARMFDADVCSIGIALKSGMIGPEEAVQWMQEIGAEVRTMPDDKNIGE
jgi:hypothetical protein